MEINADSWLRPSEALKILCGPFDEYTATETVLKCLRGDHIQSFAMNSAIEFKDRSPVKEPAMSLISAKYWANAPSGTEWKQFWKTGVIRFYSTEIFLHPRSIALLCYDVRFDPVGIQALVPPKEVVQPSHDPAKAQAADISPALLTVPKIEKNPIEKKPLSEFHLKAWWDFYQAVTPTNRDTEPYAIQHCERCFPENTVPRKKIREMRGARKSGPKPKSAG